MDFNLTPSKHTMRLRERERHPLTIIANQYQTRHSHSHFRNIHSHSPPQITTRHATHYKPRIRSASAPNLTPKRRSELLSRSASKKKLRGPVTGNPDDLEDWEWDDPIVRRLADAVFAIREERKATMKRLEAIDQKIDALRRNLVEKERV